GPDPTSRDAYFTPRRYGRWSCAVHPLHLRRLNPRLRVVQRGRPQPGSAPGPQRRPAVPRVSGARSVRPRPDPARSPRRRRRHGRRPPAAGAGSGPDRTGRRAPDGRRQRPAAGPAGRRRVGHRRVRRGARRFPARPPDPPGLRRQRLRPHLRRRCRQLHRRRPRGRPREPLAHQRRPRRGSQAIRGTRRPPRPLPGGRSVLVREHDRAQPAGRLRGAALLPAAAPRCL
ncbi:MAG: hypothetical protein AVDCRST_MAG59-3688, partial [uncultured Thermomicrobiales bacterium]